MLQDASSTVDDRKAAIETAPSVASLAALTQASRTPVVNSHSRSTNTRSSIIVGIKSGLAPYQDTRRQIEFVTEDTVGRVCGRLAEVADRYGREGNGSSVRIDLEIDLQQEIAPPDPDRDIESGARRQSPLPSRARSPPLCNASLLQSRRSRQKAAEAARPTCRFSPAPPSSERLWRCLNAVGACPRGHARVPDRCIPPVSRTA